MAKEVHHQFSVFGFQKPLKSIPLTPRQVKILKEGRELNRQGKSQSAAAKLRDFNDALERFESRMK